MIRYTPSKERQLSLFKTPFETHLDPENRWVKMSDLVPWDDFAKVIQKNMSKKQGRGSIDLRVVVGALLVKHIMNLSDEETIRYIQENIYAQYFVGLPGFQREQVFTASLFVTLRKRLGIEGATKLNEVLLRRAEELKLLYKGKGQSAGPANTDESSGKGGKEKSKEDEIRKAGMEVRDEEGRITHKGILKLDATVAPQHIKYPTDVSLLHHSREQSEYLLDKLYEKNKHLWSKKPRTYRRKARLSYLSFSKKRRKGKAMSRKARKQQLGYLGRNIRHLQGMLDVLEEKGEQINWNHTDWRRFWIIQEVYRQQKEMHRDQKSSIDNRIVSVNQPYVRPIKRGKSGRETEFGAKLHVMEFDGFVMLEHMSYENYNESLRLRRAIEKYKELFGYYPRSILVDRIYLTRDNRGWLKKEGIKHYGKPLGRPPKMSSREKGLRKKVQNKRSEIEGEFGVAKMKYGLNCIKMKNSETSGVAVSLLLLAFNVFTLSQALIFYLLSWVKGEKRGIKALGGPWFYVWRKICRNHLFHFFAPF